MKERVIYTSIVGGFDALMQPEVTDPRYDYVCFVRKGEAGAGRAGLWQLREIPVDIPDPRRLSRYPKMHPSELLPGYRWSLWMDGNLQIVSELFYRRVDEIIESGVEMAAPVHPKRDCIYDEALAVVSAGKEEYAPAARTIKFLRSKGYPRHAGLCENALLLRDGGSEAVRRLDAMWWECLGSLSGRDQLSLMYCARECGVRIAPLLPEGRSIRDWDALAYVYHDRKPAGGWLAGKWRGLLKALAKKRLAALLASF